MNQPASKTLRTGPYKSLVHRWFYEHENPLIVIVFWGPVAGRGRGRETWLGEGRLGWGMTASYAGSAVLGLAVYRAISLLVYMASIVTDEEVFAQFKEDSQKQYNRMWHVLL
jgi:hypothetical protein